MQLLVKPLIAAWAFVRAAFYLCIMRTTVPVDIPIFTDAELAAMPSGILRANRSFVFNSDNDRYEKWDGTEWVAAFSGGGVADATISVAGKIRAAADDTEMGGSAAIIAVTPARLRSFLASVHFGLMQADIITGDGSQTLWDDIALNVGSPDAVQYTIIQVSNLTTGVVVPSSEITITKDGSMGTYSIEFATAPANTESYVATVIGGY